MHVPNQWWPPARGRGMNPANPNAQKKLTKYPAMRHAFTAVPRTPFPWTSIPSRRKVSRSATGRQPRSRFASPQSRRAVSRGDLRSR